MSEQLRVLPEDGRACPLAYSYKIELHGRELLAFHWHPAGATPVRTPHLHVHAEVQVGDAWLHKAHLPTGPVSPIDVLRLLLDDFGVPPLRDDDREATLAHAARRQTLIACLAIQAVWPMSS